MSQEKEYLINEINRLDIILGKSNSETKDEIIKVLNERKEELEELEEKERKTADVYRPSLSNFMSSRKNTSSNTSSNTANYPFVKTYTPSKLAWGIKSRVTPTSEGGRKRKTRKLCRRKGKKARKSRRSRK